VSAAVDHGRDVLAAAWTGKPGRITLGQAKLLLQAAQWAKLSTRELATLVVNASGREQLDELSPADFDSVMDRFVGCGFRDPAVPMVTAAQLACLDEGRRRLGLTGRQYVDIIRKLGGVPSRRQLDGVGFMQVWKLFHDHGAGVPLPDPRFMNRQMIGLLHHAAFRAGISADTFTAWRVYFGGVPSLALLDERAFMRLLARFDHMGVRPWVPAPTASGEPGMATQAQLNLIWKLWWDVGGKAGRPGFDEAMPARLKRLGPRKCLEGLTLRGARGMIDGFLPPVIAAREAQ